MSAAIETPLPVAQDRAVATARTPEIRLHGRGTTGLPLAVAIFISAFLLFQVQLILGKEVLPLFGGASAVWIVCVFVFELLFLAGYGYSHALATWLPVRKQAVLHGALLGISAIFLGGLGYVRSAPIGPAVNWRPQLGASPTWTIVEFLLTSIGLPFLLLSATSPLMQHWAAQAGPGRPPYRLYALSNTGSLLGLLSYPVLVEPYLGLRVQRWAWAAGYGVFLVSYFFSARSAVRSAAPAAEKEISACESRSGEPAAGWPRRLLCARRARRPR